MTTEQFTLLKAEALPPIIADLEAAVAADTATASAAAATATARAAAALVSQLEAAASEVAAEAAMILASGYADRAEAAETAVALLSVVAGVYSEATIAAAVAAGLADLTLGQSFAAVGADVDHVGIYLIETGPVATEIAQIATVAGLMKLVKAEAAYQFTPVDRLPRDGGPIHPIILDSTGRADLWQTADGIDGRFAKPGTLNVPVSGDVVPVLLDASNRADLWQTPEGIDGRFARPGSLNVPMSGGAVPLAMDSTGRADLWQTADGIDGRFANASARKIPVTGGRLPVLLDKASYEVAAMTGGAVYFPGDLVKPDTVIADALGHAQVFARTVDPVTLEPTLTQLTFSQLGDFTAPVAVDNGLIRTAVAHDGLYTRGAVGFRVVLGANGKLRILIVHGQSNAVGAVTAIEETVTTEVITALAPLPGKMLMFNGGIMPHQDRHEAPAANTPMDPSVYATVVDAREGSGETVRECLAGGAAEVLAGPWGGDDPVLVFNAGHGSSDFYELVYDALDVKQVPWQNIEAMLNSAVAYAATQSLTPEVVGFIWNQGESDQNDSASTWAAKMATLRAAVDDLADITGQTAPIPMILCQVGAPRASTGLASSPTVGAELATHVLPDTYCAPIYWADNGDYATVHYPSLQHRLIGEYCGKILADIAHGSPRRHLRAVSAVRSGVSVTVTMSEPVTIDTFGVLDPGKFGVSYSDDTGVIGISAVRAVGASLQITLQATPSGTGEFLSIACDNAKQYDSFYGCGRQFGQRSCIRAIAPRGWSQTTGRPFWEWAAHQRITVTS